MSVDLRGFTFSLEALRRKHEWQRDAAQRRLAAAERRLEALQEALRELHETRERAAAHCAQAAGQRFDPARHRQGLAYLSGVHDRIDAQEALIAKAEHARDELRRECIEGQRRLELDEALRRTQREDYCRDERLRAAAEADRDWIARRHWKGAATPLPPQEETRR